MRHRTLRDTISYKIIKLFYFLKISYNNVTKCLRVSGVSKGYALMICFL